MKIEIRGVEKLSFRERQVVALKEMGLSQDKIAARLGVSPATVATMYHRARTKGYEVVIILPGETLGIFEPGDVEGSEGQAEGGSPSE